MSSQVEQIRARWSDTRHCLRDADEADVLALLAEVDRLRAVILAEVAENDMLKGHIPSNFGIGSGVGPQSVDEIVVFAEQRLRVNRECAYWLVARELRDLRVGIVHTACPDPDGNPYCCFTEDDRETEGTTLLEAVDALKESR